MEISTEEAVRLSRIRCSLADGSARRARIAAGLRTTEVAQVLGVPPKTVRAWEAGERAPRPDVALRYAELLDQLMAGAA